MYVRIFPFQFLLDGRRGTFVSGTILVSSGLTTIFGTLSDLDDGVIIQFNFSVTEDLISITLTGEVVIEIEGLGEANVNFTIIDSIFGTSIEVTVDADFEPKDLVDWVSMDPDDTDLRDQLLVHLPFLQMVWQFGLDTWFLAGEFGDDTDEDDLEDDDEDWDLDAFQDFETDPDDPPLNTPPVSRWSEEEYVISSFQIDGVTYILDSLKWVRADSVTFEEASHMAGIWRDLDLRLTGTALVHVPGFGTSGRVEVIRPRGYVDVGQIVAEALRL